MVDTYYCPGCGTRLRLEKDVAIYYCPEHQWAFGADFLQGLVKMAVDWKESLDERVYGSTSP